MLCSTAVRGAPDGKPVSVKAAALGAAWEGGRVQLRLLSGVQMDEGILVVVLGLEMVCFPAQEQRFKTYTGKPHRASEIYLCLRRILVDKQHLVFVQGSSSLLQSDRLSIVT